MDSNITAAETLFFQGTEYLEAGAYADAERCLKSALQLFPDFAQAHANLGLTLEKQKDFPQAEACYLKAIEINPEHAESHLNLGVLLAHQKQFEAAEASLQRALTLKPHLAETWSNLGVLYAATKRELEAERCHRTALFLDPECAMASFNLSYLLLLQGRFEEGWQRLELRDWYQSLANYLTMPRWTGESLAQKSLLISYEAGHGDVIQFCRYSAQLKAMGASRITLICHPPLKALLATLEGIDELIDYNAAIPPSGWDYWTPLLSIPDYCQTRLNNIPAALPYLSAAPERVAKFVGAIPKQGLRIGLVWKGNPNFENDADRSLPSIEVLAPLWGVTGVHFISLQKGEGENEQPPGPMLAMASEIGDFADTAAIISCLDLVICVDTAAAHLTGALGMPCWVLLPAYKSDWRWLKERCDSPWYPDVMQLYRQSAMGDWGPVVQQLARDLKARVEETKI